jgi:hypothetical protein
MTIKPALDALETFVTTPTPRNASVLVEIPAVYELLSYKKGLGYTFSQITVDVCQWILNRDKMVLDSLIKGPEPMKLPDHGIEKTMATGMFWEDMYVLLKPNPTIRQAAAMACPRSKSGQNILN